jgi:hypothetical protein
VLPGLGHKKTADLSGAVAACRRFNAPECTVERPGGGSQAAHPGSGWAPLGGYVRSMSIEDRREAVKELAGRGEEVRRERVGGVLPATRRFEGPTTVSLP